MAQRVFSTLGHWVTLDDDAARRRDPRRRHRQARCRNCARRARELFACALETPGGLKVQTIHALCTRLLQQFPFEANVPARFTVLDERDQAEMMERASLGVLLRAASAPDSDDRPRAGGGDDLGRRHHLPRRGARSLHEPRHVSGLDRARRLDRARDGGIVGRARRRAAGRCATRSIATSSTARICRARDGSGGASVFEPAAQDDADQAQRLREALDAYRRAPQIERYLQRVLHQGDGGARKSLATKKIAEADPALCAALTREAERIGALLQRRRAVADARPHPGAAADRHRGRRRHPPREAGARPARLRRPDRQDAGDARPRLRRLGALQARPRRRSRADRRGAGHQPAAMGHRRAADRRIHRRRRRARRHQAHHLRGRRREAVDLLVPGRGAARIRRAARGAAEPLPQGRAEFREGQLQLLVPLRRGDPAIGRPRVSRRRRSIAASTPTRPTRCTSR